MPNCLLAWENAVVTGAVSAGAEVAGLEASQLQNPHGSPATAWQTPAGVVTPAAGAWFLVDAGADGAAWRAFLLARTNLSPAATVRWRVGSAAALAGANPPGPFAFDTGTVPAGVVPDFGQSVRAAPSAVAGRCCRCDVADPANPDGFINVPLAFAGPAWQPARNFGHETADAPEAGAEAAASRGGQEFVNFRFWRRAYALALPMVAAAERWPQLDRLLRAAAAGGNVLFVPNPDSADLGREALFGRVSEPGAVAYSFRGNRYRAWQGRIAERL